jgi:hypothetical protein
MTIPFKKKKNRLSTNNGHTYHSKVSQGQLLGLLRSIDTLPRYRLEQYLLRSLKVVLKRIKAVSMSIEGSNQLLIVVVIQGIIMVDLKCNEWGKLYYLRP